MKYRVILAFETYSVGNVIEPSGLWADSLKSRGYIKPLEQQPHPGTEFGKFYDVQTGKAIEKPKAKVGRPRKDANRMA